MIKHIAALIAGAIFSASASASFIQYDFDVHAGQSNISGYFIQDRATHRLAYYNFTSYFFNTNTQYDWSIHYFPSSDSSHPTAVSKDNWAPGPDNFSVIEYLTVQYGSTVELKFDYVDGHAWAATGTFAGDGQWFTGVGYAEGGAVTDQLLLAALESGEQDNEIGNWTPVIKAEVPEPTTTALLLLGAAGIVGARRKARQRAVK